MSATPAASHLPGSWACQPAESRPASTFADAWLPAAPQSWTGLGLAKNRATAAPTSTTAAGSRIDWAIAVENPACRNPGRVPPMAIPSPADAAGPPDGSSAASRDWIRTAMAALPSTAPNCRVVLYTPEPAPAWRGGRLRVAVVLNGAQMPALAKPRTALGSRNNRMGVSGCISRPFQTRATAINVRPPAARYFGLTRSTILPTTGAMPPEISAMGTIRSADWVG